jgi:hypothetical protein
MPGVLITLRPAYFMKLFTPFFLTFLLLGCSSSGQLDNPEQFQTMTGGQSVGGTTSFYWYTAKLDQPYSSADYVMSGPYGWYQSDYHWQDEQLHEMVREGEKRNREQKLVEFKVHLRFSQSGEAVYQQYLLDDRIIPLTPEEIQSYQAEARAVIGIAEAQSRRGQHLFQGEWDGETFDTCSGQEYTQLEFNQILPDFVLKRLASVDSYMAMIGGIRGGKLSVADLLLLEDDSFDCIERPVLIEE